MCAPKACLLVLSFCGVVERMRVLIFGLLILSVFTWFLVRLNLVWLLCQSLLLGA